MWNVGGTCGSMHITSKHAFNEHQTNEIFSQTLFLDTTNLLYIFMRKRFTSTNTTVTKISIWNNKNPFYYKKYNKICKNKIIKQYETKYAAARARQKQIGGGGGGERERHYKGS
jgi:ribosomal protein L31